MHIERYKDILRVRSVESRLTYWEEVNEERTRTPTISRRPERSLSVDDECVLHRCDTSTVCNLKDSTRDISAVRAGQQCSTRTDDRLTYTGVRGKIREKQAGPGGARARCGA